MEGRAKSPPGAAEPAPYTVRELSKRLGVGKVGLYEAIARGEVPHIRIGRRIVLPREAIDRWLACTDAGASHPGRSR